MKIEIRRIEPTATEPETWLGAPDLTPANVWEDDIEHADFGSGELAGRGRRVWLATGLVVTVVAIGILGRFVPGTAVHPSLVGSAARDTAAEPTLPFSIVTPAAGATIDGAVIAVRGGADEAVGTIDLGVVVGGAVIGWTTVQVDHAGSWSVAIPVFAPPVTTDARLVVSVLAPGALPPRTALQMTAAAAIQRPLTLHSNGPIEIWPVTVERSGARSVVSVAGSAPLAIDSVTVGLVAADGHRLASQTAGIVVDDTQPGSVGGHALGLGSFAATLRLPEQPPTGPLRVAIDWRDVVGGEWGTAVVTIDPVVTFGRPR